MMRTRKGFTLVELLIVVAILAGLGGIMTYSVNGATAKAKAATIATNVNACKNAVALYVADENRELPGLAESISDLAANDVLAVALPTWIDLTRDDKIKYAGTSGKKPENWAITVDFTNDPYRDEIKTELQKIRGYHYYDEGLGIGSEVMGNNVYKFEVMLMSGRIQPITTSTPAP